MEKIISLKIIDLKIFVKTIYLLSGKWKMKIIAFLLINGKTRFMDLQRGVDGISSKVLSQELQYMEKTGIISRIVRDPKLNIIEYQLTESGYKLESLISIMTVWGIEHFKISCDKD